MFFLRGGEATILDDSLVSFTFLTLSSLLFLPQLFSPCYHPPSPYLSIIVSSSSPMQSVSVIKRASCDSHGNKSSLSHPIPILGQARNVNTVSQIGNEISSSNAEGSNESLLGQFCHCR